MNNIIVRNSSPDLLSVEIACTTNIRYCRVQPQNSFVLNNIYNFCTSQQFTVRASVHVCMDAQSSL